MNESTSAGGRSLKTVMSSARPFGDIRIEAKFRPADRGTGN
jgi:hypothetical protein